MGRHQLWDSAGQLVVDEETLDPILAKPLISPNNYIDVTNPPQSTNLLPLEFKDVHQDTLRMQSIFDYVLAKQISYAPVVGGQYTGINYTVFFPAAIYTFDAEIILKGAYLTLAADRAIVRTTHSGFAFSSTGSNGWKTRMSGFSFDRCNGLKQDNNNLEAGKTDIENCWFYYCPEALNIKKQSSMTFIDKCHFYRCGLIGTFELTDAVYMSKNWFSEAPRYAGNLESIINKTQLYIEHCFFIPAVQTDETLETAWIGNYGSVTVKECRIGSEPGSKVVVNNYTPAHEQQDYAPTAIEVRQCENLACAYGDAVVRLFAFPNVIRVSDNRITPLLTIPIKYADGYAGADITPFNGRQDLCLVDVSGNVGQSVNAWSAPMELKQFER